MTHPSETDLALYAGQDQGFLARFGTARHLKRCESCGRRVEELRAIREWMGAREDLPAGVQWDALSLEMRANIRVGLAAGRCVAPATRTAPGFRWQPVALVLPVLLVFMAGWLLQSWPRPAAPGAGPVLEATASGISLERDGRAFTVLYPQDKGATLSDGQNAVRSRYVEVSGQNSVRVRYLDSETGNVTISHVYAQ